MAAAAAKAIVMERTMTPSPECELLAAAYGHVLMAAVARSLRR